MPQSIIIIGAGITGLSIGWNLSRLGAPVVLYEKGVVGGEASWAAAGMITPVSEIRYGEEEILNLFLESLALYPSFIKGLSDLNLGSADFRTNGSYMVAVDADDEVELNRLYDYQRALSLPVHPISVTEMVRSEPLLNPNCRAALEVTREFSLDNRLLVLALKEAITSHGGTVRENQPVDRLEIVNGKCESIIVRETRIKASRVILATGICTTIEGLPETFNLPIRPVKGQILHLLNNSGNHLSRSIRTIHRYPVYLVPRSDGRILVGATSEEKGFNKDVTAGAILDLLYGAWKVLPSIDEMPLVESCVGHRAAARDHAPILGPTEIEGLYMAMGMYRHGFLLAPLVGKLMADLVLMGRESNLMKEFGYRRFLGAQPVRQEAKGKKHDTRSMNQEAEFHLSD